MQCWLRMKAKQQIALPFVSITDRCTKSNNQKGSDVGKGSVSTSLARWSLSCSTMHWTLTRAGSFLFPASSVQGIIDTRNRESPAFGGFTVDGIGTLCSSRKWLMSCEMKPPWLTTNTFALSRGTMAYPCKSLASPNSELDPKLVTRSRDGIPSSNPANDTLGHIGTHMLDKGNTFWFNSNMFASLEIDVQLRSKTGKSSRSGLCKPASQKRVSSKAFWEWLSSSDSCKTKEGKDSASWVAADGFRSDPLLVSAPCSTSVLKCLRFNDSDLESKSCTHLHTLQQHEVSSILSGLLILQPISDNGCRNIMNTEVH